MRVRLASGTIVAPASVGGHIFIPAGSVISGVVENVNRIGLGLKHTTATIGYNFDALRLTNGETVPIRSELVEVETAKEHVDGTGKGPRNPSDGEPFLYVGLFRGSYVVKIRSKVNRDTI